MVDTATQRIIDAMNALNHSNTTALIAALEQGTGVMSASGTTTTKTPESIAVLS